MKGIEMNKIYSPDEMTKDLVINPYKEAILKEPTRTKDQVPMEEWYILSDHVKYITHSKSETFQKLSINPMNYRQKRDLYGSLNNKQTIKENFPMIARGYTRGHLLDGTDCDVLIDTGASKSYMSKSYFL